ncbi:MAG: transglutaminase-like cysteine peptidase [Xanthobacteraceae bacterium]|nr:transglutaminase-like cysteine peptidase [Xanthobacteraceae bacterium]
MSVLRWPRGGMLLLALVLAAAATTSAVARQNTKKAVRPPEAAQGINVPTTAHARFFTINQVLANRDGQRPGAPGLQLAATTMTLTDEPAAAPRLLPPSEPFGLATFRAPEGLLWVKWREVERRMQAEAWEIALCQTDREACSPHALFFLRIVDSAQARGGRARLEVVNRAVNAAIRYTSDYAQHGVADLWTPPLATLASGRGDCEDYAIAKYALLRAAGIADDDLRLLLVRDRAVRQDHAVLAVREDGQWLVLDNRHSMLAEPNRLPQFAPLFAIDHNGVSLFAAPYAQGPAPAVRPAAVTAPPAADPKKQGAPDVNAAAHDRAARLPPSTSDLL